jgi:hypothetical protein
MATTPKWLAELRCQEMPRGTVRVLREILETGSPQEIAGIQVPPEAAESILEVYDGLPPWDQEQFAVACNADFLAVARQCLLHDAARTLRRLFFQWLRKYAEQEADSPAK